MGRLLAAVLVAPLLALVPAAAPARPAPPLESSIDLPDPSVSQAPDGTLVVVGTSTDVVRAVSGNGRRWRQVDAALATRPAWARPHGTIWASDIERRAGRWLLYYSAPVTGLHDNSHCIGIAIAAHYGDPFVPVGDAPLVCPSAAAAPPAADTVADPGASAPRPAAYGAIDPFLHVEHGEVYLLYKTQGEPSSIRVLPLSPDGLQMVGPSVRLLRDRGTVEGPAVLHRGRFYYLIYSTGDFATCDYATVYRRSKSLSTDWHKRPAKRLLTHRRTRLCGPGGVDVLLGERVRIYFHAWVCGERARVCGRRFDPRQGDGPASPRRVLYGATLRFPDDRPVIGRWLRPPA